ncbi:MAG: hypothetical protein VKP62_16825 [Candidatus Sericytochromatia bacterium]|nr:hypothetical protein [Candidatus Sericytochromatia bacterium]
MLKIQHPAAIVRDRQKGVNNWESVRLYRYANGVELQILVGHLPHGELQSAVSANRALTFEKSDKEAVLRFGDAPLPMVDFLSGARIEQETANTFVLDECRFLPSVQAPVRQGSVTQPLQADGNLLTAVFSDGTRVEVEPHGNHGHVRALRDGKPLRCFFNGKDNVLDVFGLAD